MTYVHKYSGIIQGNWVSNGLKCNWCTSEHGRHLKAAGWCRSALKLLNPFINQYEPRVNNTSSANSPWRVTHAVLPRCMRAQRSMSWAGLIYRRERMCSIDNPSSRQPSVPERAAFTSSGMFPTVVVNLPRPYKTHQFFYAHFKIDEQKFSHRNILIDIYCFVVFGLFLPKTMIPFTALPLPVSGTDKTSQGSTLLTGEVKWNSCYISDGFWSGRSRSTRRKSPPNGTTSHLQLSHRPWWDSNPDSGDR